MPEIRERFVVGSPADVVWDFFQDVPAVGECMPGVALTPSEEEGVYAGEMKTKLGPISATFQGTAKVTETDPEARTGTITAQGVDKRQASRVRATVGYALAPEGSGTAVEVTANIALQGSMAQFGRTGILQEVSSQMTAEFARCLEVRLAGDGGEGEDAGSATAGAAPAAAAPRQVDGFRLLRIVLAAWLRRVFRRPAREDRKT
jgi:carbon monoxide dehydrogenase subunit G